MKNLLLTILLLAFLFACGAKQSSSEVIKETVSYKDSMTNIEIEGEILGNWFWDRNIQPMRSVLHEKSGTLFMTTIFKNGEKMEEEASKSGNKIVEIDNAHGEFYLIINGILEFHGKNGKFGEALPI
jgi:hypothetical protein